MPTYILHVIYLPVVSTTTWRHAVQPSTVFDRRVTTYRLVYNSTVVAYIRPHLNEEGNVFVDFGRASCVRACEWARWGLRYSVGARARNGWGAAEKLIKILPVCCGDLYCGAPAVGTYSRYIENVLIEWLTDARRNINSRSGWCGREAGRVSKVWARRAMVKHATGTNTRLTRLTESLSQPDTKKLHNALRGLARHTDVNPQLSVNVRQSGWHCCW